MEAADEAGNVASRAHTYAVVYDFDGFFSPVDNPDALNRIQAGSAVPVKFGLSGDQGLDVFAEGYPKSQRVTGDSAAPVDNIEQTVSAGGAARPTSPPRTGTATCGRRARRGATRAGSWS